MGGPPLCVPRGPIQPREGAGATASPRTAHASAALAVGRSSASPCQLSEGRGPARQRSSPMGRAAAEKPLPKLLHLIYCSADYIENGACNCFPE